MRIQRIEYHSPVDALVALAKRVNTYEERQQLPSETFYDCYCKGQMEDSQEFVEWAGNYQQYLAIKIDLERQLRHAA